MTRARMSGKVFALLLAVVLCLVWFPIPTHADGGAPNLAYVAGASHGISVIDIAQQKVTGTISVAGDPHTVLLSLNGRFLYVTQPALGRVSVIAARTGQTICTADLPGHPTLMALSSDASTLYVAGTEGNIGAIDPTTCAVQQAFETHDRVYGFALIGITTGNTFSNQLWIAGTDAITILDDKGQQQGLIPITGGRNRSLSRQD